MTSGFLQRYKTHSVVHVCGAGSSQAGGKLGDLPPGAQATRWPGRGLNPGSARTQPGAHRHLCPPQGRAAAGQEHCGHVAPLPHPSWSPSWQQKRLEDQHRLLKPTAVPSIFHLAEKKRRAGGHGRPRRRDTGKASAGLRAQASDPVDGKAAAGSPSSSSASPMAKPEPRKLKRATPQGRTAARAARETAGQERGRQPLEGRAEDGPASAATSCSQGEAGTGAEDAGEEGATPADSGLVDRSGVSADDFTPPGSGACKFIGSLHSYSFSSKHARERPAVPREPVERKRLRRDAEPGCSGSSPGPEKGPAQSPPRACPSASSSLTATPQKPAQGASVSIQTTLELYNSVNCIRFLIYLVMSSLPLQKKDLFECCK